MYTITQKDLAYAPATTLMELFKLRFITPVDVLEAQKAEVEKTNGEVNAIVNAYWYVSDSVHRAFEVLRAQGATVDAVDFDFEIEGNIFDIISKMAIGGAMGGMFKSFADRTDQMTHYVAHFVEKALTAGYGPDDLFEMQGEVKRLWSKLSDEVYAKGYDLVLAPIYAMAHVPAQHDFTRGVPLTEDGVTYPLGVLMQYTLPWNLLNWCPVVVVPTGLSPKGIPLGMQIIGKPKDTATVFRVAYAYSKGAQRFFTGDLFPGGY